MGLDIHCKCGQTAFRAGSYSGYNWWREILAKLVGITDINAFWIKTGGINNRKGKEPFFELINFSDCEGTLPLRECKRLKKDFDYWSRLFHKQNAIQIFWFKLFSNSILSKDEWEYWLEKFDKWHEAVNHAVKDKCNIIFS